MLLFVLSISLDMYLNFNSSSIFACTIFRSIIITLIHLTSPYHHHYHLHSINTTFHLIVIITFTQCRGHDPKDLFKVWKENCLIGDDLNFDKENVMQPSQSQKNKETKKNNLSVHDKKTVNASGNGPGQQDSFPLPQSFASRNPVVVCHAPSLIMLCHQIKICQINSFSTCHYFLLMYCCTKACLEFPFPSILFHSLPFFSFSFIPLRSL